MSAVRKEIRRVQRKQMELHRNHWEIQPTVNSIVEGSGVFAIPADSSAAPVDYMLNGTLQGVDVHNRVGNQIKEVGLRIKGVISQNVTSLANACGAIRIIVFRDHDNKAATPTLPDLLEFTGTSSQAYNMGSLIKWSNRKRFTFLFDQTLPMNPQSTGATSAQIVAAVDINLSINKLLTMSLNSRGAGSIQDGGIYAFFMYTNPFGNPTGTELPKFEGCVSFTFVDV